MTLVNENYFCVEEEFPSMNAAYIALDKPDALGTHGFFQMVTGFMRYTECYLRPVLRAEIFILNEQWQDQQPSY